MANYLLPRRTGSYTSKFATVDDSAILSVGGTLHSNIVHKNNLQLHRGTLQSMVASHEKEVFPITSKELSICMLDSTTQ
ncbi:uncharacterized protein SPAR_A00810 [Saccharomyces paradoxus]|uniref:Uncharacterized protein n=1 Tax=Saccharomyces paradoxus TaxID=27291 RepID=A0A8B8UL31_SACPA|nr:uncharacterized protein SPAR_A00810 [Saccharomyces paradoxus]QHS71457.1 hypothetical protein SPAR_A00810 [Saccharomyces paradoxus]